MCLRHCTSFCAVGNPYLLQFSKENPSWGISAIEVDAIVVATCE